jgi:hypothetical protein
MRHTVIGLFDTYAQAESARDTLVQTGFAFDTIELQANPAPSALSAPAPTGAPDAVAGAGVLASIERFIASLFAREPRAPQAQRYTDAVRGGAVLVCVSAASESHAELASATLTRLGATDIGERQPDWETDPQDLELGREHSMLDELGIGAAAPRVDVVPPVAVTGETVPDEFLEYEEDFRNHYDERYASSDERYEDYVPAYRYGATIGRDARYRDRPWDDVEPEARRHWETTSPASTDTWERFKAAVRHGWDRVTGHHHV